MGRVGWWSRIFRRVISLVSGKKESFEVNNLTCSSSNIWTRCYQFSWNWLFIALLISHLHWLCTRSSALSSLAYEICVIINVAEVSLCSLQFYIHRSVHRESNLIIFQQDATYSVYYISVGTSTCFGCWHPSSGAGTAVITASGID